VAGQGGAAGLRSGTQDSLESPDQDTGQGASRSEVIQGAAEHSARFPRGYTKVYREYHTVMKKRSNRTDRAYRFYVRRYFQLHSPASLRRDFLHEERPERTVIRQVRPRAARKTVRSQVEQFRKTIGATFAKISRTIV
jgi:hypothetical protein